MISSSWIVIRSEIKTNYMYAKNNKNNFIFLADSTYIHTCVTFPIHLQQHASASVTKSTTVMQYLIEASAYNL